MKALCEDPFVSRKINARALSQYLSLNYVLSNDSIFDGVKKLPAANYLIVGKSCQTKPICYWDLASHFRNKTDIRSEAEATQALRALLDDSVRLRLASDVPLGAFLSGGIDSSAIVASMCQAGDRQSVFSFSMGFREKTFSELHEARKVADALGVFHRGSFATPDTANLLAKMVYYADEPFADTSIIPMYLLAEFSRKYVTVCLSGDGGDEIFAGYETYTADRIHHLTKWLPTSVSLGLLRAVNRAWPVSFNKISADYKVRKFLQGHSYKPTMAHYHWRTIFSEEEKRTLLRPALRDAVLEEDPFGHFEAYFAEVADCHYLDQGMYVDIKTWLVDDILLKVDRATMAHALEARAPFLDYRLVEFAASLPVHWKMNGFEKKYLLKRSQHNRLPDFVLKRKKQGFNAPVSYWLNSSLRDQYKSFTMSNQQPFFEPSFVEELWRQHEQKERDNNLRLFGIINFLLWAEQFDAWWE